MSRAAAIALALTVLLVGGVASAVLTKSKSGTNKGFTVLRSYETIDLRTQKLVRQTDPVDQLGWGRPAIANYFCAWRIEPSEVDSLSRYCWITGGIEMQQQTPQQLRAVKEGMKKRYKRPVMVAYVNLAEFFTNIKEKEPVPGAWHKFMAMFDESDYLYDADGNIVPFWDPKTSVMLNLTQRSTVAKLVDWTMAVHDSTIWDGYMGDNNFNEYAWQIDQKNIAFYEIGPEDRTEVMARRAAFRADSLEFANALRRRGIDPDDQAASDEASLNDPGLIDLEIKRDASYEQYEQVFTAARKREYERRCLENVEWAFSELRRRLGPDKFIYANSAYGNVGMRYLNGRLTENTLKNGQARSLHSAYATGGFSPSVSIMHWSVKSPEDLPATRYGLTYTNVWTDDAFAVDIGAEWHHAFRWYEDLYAPFGRPLTDGFYGMKSVGVRVFEKAVVLNNESGTARWIRVILPNGKAHKFKLGGMDGHIVRSDIAESAPSAVLN